MRTTTQLKLSKFELLLPVNGKSKPENTEIDAYVDEQEHPVKYPRLKSWACNCVSFGFAETYTLQ